MRATLAFLMVVATTGGGGVKAEKQQTILRAQGVRRDTVEVVVLDVNKGDFVVDQNGRGSALLLQTQQQGQEVVDD